MGQKIQKPRVSTLLETFQDEFLFRRDDFAVCVSDMRLRYAYLPTIHLFLRDEVTRTER